MKDTQLLSLAGTKGMSNVVLERLISIATRANNFIYELAQDTDLSLKLEVCIMSFSNPSFPQQQGLIISNMNLSRIPTSEWNRLNFHGRLFIHFSDR